MSSNYQARVLAKHQLAYVLPGGVACTCGAELAALNAAFDDETVKGEPLALAIHQLQEMEESADLAHDLAAKIEAVRGWLTAADPYPERNGNHFAELRRVLSGPKLDPLAVLQRAARRAEGERDTAALEAHMPDCRYHDEIGCASQPRMEPNYNPWVGPVPETPEKPRKEQP